MKDKQTLYSQKIYQVNQALDEFKKVCKLGNQFIGFCGLNYYNRKFNWYVVDRWDFNKNIVNNIKECCMKHNEEWKNYLKELENLKNEALKESIKYFDEIIRSTSGISESSEEYCENFHFHFLNIYQSYPIDSDKYFDGIMYRNFRREKGQLRYATGETLSNLQDAHHAYPWLDITLNFKGRKEITSFSCQECGEDEYDIKYESPDRKIIVSTKLKKPPSSAHSQADKLYFYYLLPIVARYNHPVKKGEWYEGKYNQNDYLLQHDHVAPYKFLLFIPVYDAPICKEPYGNFFGNITIPFDSDRERKAFIDKNINVIEENLFLLIK